MLRRQYKPRFAHPRDVAREKSWYSGNRYALGHSASSDWPLAAKNRSNVVGVERAIGASYNACSRTLVPYPSIEATAVLV